MLLRSRPNPYLSSRRPRRPRLWLWLLAVPLSLVLLEVLLQIVVGLSDRTETFARPEDADRLNAYGVQFRDAEGDPLAGIAPQGQLALQRDLGAGYRFVGEQESAFWQIDANGFRESEPVPLAKPDGELRVFVLGGSAAFGHWAASNDATIAAHLERLLAERLARQQEAPDEFQPQVLSFFVPEQQGELARTPRLAGNSVRVVNAAVPGYASGNQLAQLALQVLPYQPDAIVVVHGFRDLTLPGDEEATDIPKLDRYLDSAGMHFRAAAFGPAARWVQDLYLSRSLSHWVLGDGLTVAQRSLPVAMLARDDRLHAQLPATEAELNARVARYADRVKQMARLSAGAGVPLVVVLQPELSGRAQLTEPEQAIAQELDSDYAEAILPGYAQLAGAATGLAAAFPNNVSVLDLRELYGEDFPGAAFVDAVHLTEPASARLAQSVFVELATLRQLQVPPRDPNE